MSPANEEKGRSRRPAVLLAFFLVMMLSTSPAFSQEDIAVISIDVQGSAQIRGGDQAKARDGAVRDALRKAVRQGLLEILKIKEPARLPRDIDQLLARHDRYVDTFSVLNEGLEGGTYSIQLRVAVLSDFLVHDLKKMGIRQTGTAEAPRHHVPVRVSGLHRFEHFVRIREGLSVIPGVRQVLPRKVAEGEIWLDIESAEPPAVLAKHIESSGLFKVSKETGAPGRLDLEFQP
ncbi:MAG: hypothetical protein HPY65_04950 [Syntrophaceae bacterium]|nr:hypothetical protein [Syntrophaceae bacterium]